MKKIKRILFTLFFLVISFNGAYAQKYWGAIYIDANTGIAGGSSDAGSEGEAKNVALSMCKKKHSGRKNNCRFVFSFYNTCAAVYWAPNGTYSYGYQLILNDAQSSALRACKKAGGGNCKHALSFCTTRFY